MKIEKVNDHQIRCTLTGDDLADRQLKLSDLAYGSDKTKELFQDMMQQAAMDFGFEAEDIPLMIEAIPISPEKIVLLITKVDSPEELDTRFSQFTRMTEEDGDADDLDISDLDDAAGELLNLFDRVHAMKTEQAENTENAAKPEGTPAAPPAIRHFVCHDLDSVVNAAHRVAHFYRGNNTLYKDSRTGDFHLILHQAPHTTEDFNRVVNSVSSYLTSKKCSASIIAFLKEHYAVIVADQALQTLSDL